eukprot:2095957-Prymnesium_polylepis.1
MQRRCAVFVHSGASASRRSGYAIKRLSEPSPASLEEAARPSQRHSKNERLCHHRRVRNTSCASRDEHSSSAVQLEGRLLVASPFSTHLEELT